MRFTTLNRKVSKPHQVSSTLYKPEVNNGLGLNAAAAAIKVRRIFRQIEKANGSLSAMSTVEMVNSILNSAASGNSIMSLMGTKSLKGVSPSFIKGVDDLLQDVITKAKSRNLPIEVTNEGFAQFFLNHLGVDEDTLELLDDL